MEDTLLENQKVIVFQLQNEEYALPVEYVGAIERMHPITRFPRQLALLKVSLICGVSLFLSSTFDYDLESQKRKCRKNSG